MTGPAGRLLAYQRPFLAAVAGAGPVAAAPATVSFLLATLLVSALWRCSGAGHRLVDRCCAYRPAELAHGGLTQLLGGALLVRRPVEAVWTVAASWLVLGPLEVVVGSRRLVGLALLGQVLPTVLVGLCWLAPGRPAGAPAGLDVGTSAVVVTAAAALAVTTRSLPVAAVLAAGLAVDLAVAPDLATAEHLVAVAIGVAGALALRGDGAPSPRAAAARLGQRRGWRSPTT